MKQLICLLAILLFIFCGQRKVKVSAPLNAEVLTAVSSTVPVDTLLADPYILKFENAPSFKTTDIYGDYLQRVKLTDTIRNSHDRATKIQEYLKTRFGNYFFTADSNLVLKLSNGKTATFPFWNDETGEGFNFEHYFENIGYYLLHVQWSEGNCWMLVNRKNGFKKYIAGLPYISDDQKKILTINTDLEAGYSFNGIELYSIVGDTLRQEFSKTTKWGPADVKWTSESQFLLKREHFHVDSLTGNQDNKFDFKLVTIADKTGR